MTAAPAYVVALYRKGPAWDDASPAIEQESVHDHFRFLGLLERAGAVMHSGPFHDAEQPIGDDLVGLALLDLGDVEEARSLLADDPALARGLLVCDVRPWYAD